MRWTRLLTILGVLMLASAGCGDSGGDQSGSPGSARTGVQDSLRSVATVAADAGLELTGATGSWSVCSSNPPRLKYAAGATATPSGPVADAVAALTAALEQDGWQVDRSGTDPEPYATLTRDDLSASLAESRRAPGTVSVGVTGPCVDTTDDQDSLLGDTDDISLDG
ncbi:hypothetical protein GCM10027062_40880 [Nocardioides hungaricus]